MIHYNIEVVKEGNTITLIPNTTTDDLGDVIHAQGLWDNDISIVFAHEDGWNYLVDKAYREVGDFDSYGHPALKKLMEGESLTVEMKKIAGSDYEEYDFNLFND